MEVIFEETKNITEQLRRELEQNTQELAPLQQEWTDFQNSLDTAPMEVNLLEDTVSRALKQLESAEELASSDGKQKAKKAEFKEMEAELTAGKERVGKAEAKLKDLTEKETTLAKKNTDLLTQVEMARASIQSTTGHSRITNGCD